MRGWELEQHITALEELDQVRLDYLEELFGQLTGLIHQSCANKREMPVVIDKIMSVLEDFRVTKF